MLLLSAATHRGRCRSHRGCLRRRGVLVHLQHIIRQPAVTIGPGLLRHLRRDRVGIDIGATLGLYPGAGAKAEAHVVPTLTDAVRRWSLGQPPVHTHSDAGKKLADG